MIKKGSLKTFQYSFKLMISHELIDIDYYNLLKSKWPNFKLFPTISGGQVSRKNIEIKKKNSNYSKIDVLYQNLYDELNSKNFRNFLKSKFDLENNKEFIGDFDSSDLVMHIAESTDGYENPWHVDTRGRIIHFLIYFGDDTIEEGGELGIAKHKELDNYVDYKQYPDTNDLSEIKYFKPDNNLGIFILSENNSYHKGCAVKGLRRFIYAGFTNKNGNAWKTKNWKSKNNFSNELKNQKKNIEV